MVVQTRADRRLHAARALGLLALFCAVLSLRVWAEPAPPLDTRALVALARAAVEAEVRGDAPPQVASQTPPRAVFVTIERKGRVVGCRGALECRTRSLEEEVVLAAQAAAAHDPRYRPLRPRDLTDFLVTVTVVERLDPLDRIESLPPAEGLVLKSGARTGVVLPWEGKVRLAWAYRKAGVPAGTACTLLRMKAERVRG
jgi:hypothetical protein